MAAEKPEVVITFDL